MGDRKYWPFPVNESVFDEQKRAELEFLKSCSRDGCQSYLFGAGNYGAMSEKGRAAEIVIRGRKRWEVVLAEHGEKMSSTLTSDFTEAARLAAEWIKEM